MSAHDRALDRSRETCIDPVAGEKQSWHRRSSARTRWLARRERKLGKKRALGALAARLGRTIYHLWRKQEAFPGVPQWTYVTDVAGIYG